VTRPVPPYPPPPEGAPLRVAFVGQRTYYEQHVMEGPANGVVPLFLDHRDGAPFDATLAELERFAPHAVVVLRPETVPPGALRDVAVPVLGVVTATLPRAGRSSHPELDYNLAELSRADRDDFDRVICVDPLGFATASTLLPTWRSLPLPVADSLYRAPTPARHPPKMVYIGHPSTHREDTLLDIKHKFDLPHYAHGLMGDELRAVLAATDVAIALHNDRWLVAFESGVLLHLAAGHLVLSEPLDPTYGLDPGIHYIEFGDKYMLDLRIHQLRDAPDVYERVRIRGHHFSRQFRASAVWPRVIGDLLADVSAFGTDRAA
jgi:hypothetical protein